MATGAPPEEQAASIKKCIQTAESSLKAGDKWFLLPFKWWLLFKAYVKYDDEQVGSQEAPPTIDNNEMLENGELKSGLLEGENYTLVPEAAWSLLHSWYGGGPEIMRRAVPFGIARKLMIEIYPFTFTVEKNGNAQHKIIMSKTDSVRALFMNIASSISSAPHKMRILFEVDGDKKTLEFATISSLEAAGLQDKQVLTVEVQTVDSFSSDLKKGRSITNNVPRVSSEVVQSRPTPDKMQVVPATNGNSTYWANGTPPQVGATGLNNIGNTCFMNSALQCLSNTPQLAEYFLSDKYLKEINKTNPLGMKGELAQQYGELLKKIWSGKATAISPTHLKFTISNFAPQFTGYRQHDSQELLAFLLDGLHEDLNRVIDKPLVPPVESGGRPDEIVAEEAWQAYLRRNQSIIVDLFQGQLKSTLICPLCNKESLTFDPCMFLSLPLPASNDRFLHVTLCRTGAKPTKYGLSIPKGGTIADVKKGLSALCGVPPQNLVLADVHMGKIFSFLEDNTPSSNIRESDFTVAYEAETPQANGESSAMETESAGHAAPHRDPRILLQVVQRTAGSYANEGIPLLLVISPNTSNSTIYKQIIARIKGYINKENAPTAMDIDHDIGSFNFSLKIVEKYSLRCPKCVSGCKCTLPADESISSWKDKLLLLEWNPDQKLVNREEMKVIEEHPTSVKDVGNATLAQCMELFLKQEQLGAGDEWYCPNCKTHCQATKKFDLFKLPQILIVHLKRFQYTKFSRDKLDIMVDFPIQGWDLSPFVKRTLSEAPVYDLFAISNHMGGVGGGHYTAYAKNKNDKKWYHFNDSSVREASESELGSPAAYVLFYIKRDAQADVATPMNAEPVTPTPKDDTGPEPSHQNGHTHENHDLEQPHIGA